MTRIELGGVDVDEQQPAGEVTTYRWEWNDPGRAGLRRALVYVPGSGRWYRTARVDGGGWACAMPLELAAVPGDDVERLRCSVELVVTGRCR